MQNKTVVALYDHFENAQAAVGDVIQAGAARDRISLLANDSHGDHPPLKTNPGFAREEVDTDTDRQPGVVVGAEVGIGLGGVLGFLAGVGTLAIPGIGPLVAVGAWAVAAAGAATGGVLGGIIGALTDHGITDKDAHLYAEGLRRGGTLVSAVVTEDQVDQVTEIFKRHGGVDIDKRGESWIAEGWVSFDMTAQPLSPVEVVAARTKSAAGKDTADTPKAIRHYNHPRKAAVPDGASNDATNYAKDEMNSKNPQA